MTQDPTTDPDLNSFIPRPEAGASKRHMLSVNSDDYNGITELANKHETSRGRIITALLAYYLNDN